MKHKIINAVLFQALWFTAILTGWLYALPLMFVQLAHFLSVERSVKTRLSCFALALIGMIGDSILGLVGVYDFHADNLMVFGLIPLWLCYMWLGFSICLPLSLSWLLSSPLVLLAFFSIGGTLSYVAGRQLGALAFDDAVIPVIAVVWFGVACVVLLAQNLLSIKASAEIRLQSE